MFSLALGVVSNAQGGVILTDLSPTVGPLNVQRLTMVNLHSTKKETVRGTLIAELFDGNLNQIVRLESFPLSLAPGQVISANTVSWTTAIQYGTGELANKLRRQGRLDNGDFVLCHSFESLQTNGIIAKLCGEKKAKLDINFALVHPADQSTIRQAYPNLVWENVSQYGLRTGNITYTIQLCEQQPGQTTAQALETNVNLLFRRGLTRNMLKYPVGLPPLEAGSTYAWMVRVLQGQDEILVSQPWSFTVAQNSAKSVTADKPSYPMVSTAIDSRVYRFGKNIHFGFDNNEGIEKLSYTINGISVNARKLSNLPVISDLGPGLNTIDIPTDKLGLLPGRVYRLAIATPHKQSYYLQFKYFPKG